MATLVSLTLKRRHLSESQRAMVAARLAGLGRGRPEENPPIGEISAAAAASLLNVGDRSIERARVVQRDAVPAVAQAVERGEVAVSAASEFARQPREEPARLADEYDAAQERGEVAKGSVRTDIVPDGNDVRPATAADLGLSRKDIHEARVIRDAERADPGVVQRTLSDAIERGDEPSKARMREAVFHVARNVAAAGTGRGGTTYTQNVSRIGKRQAMADPARPRRGRRAVTHPESSVTFSSCSRGRT